MKKASKQTQSVWLFIGFYLLAGVFNLLTKTRITLVDYEPESGRGKLVFMDDTSHLPEELIRKSGKRDR